MKMKFALLTGIVLLFTFTQCEKDACTEIETNNNTLNLKLIEEVQQLSSQSDQRLAYNLLNPAEKAKLWKQKISNLLKSDTLTEQQRRHIEKLSLFIKIGIFEKTNVDTTSVVSSAKNWCIEGLNYFTIKEIIKIAFDISNASVKTNSLKPGSVAPKSLEVKDCSCNTSSAFSCNSCSSGKCTIGSGCGFLWASPCDGRCSAPMK